MVSRRLFFVGMIAGSVPSLAVAAEGVSSARRLELAGVDNLYQLKPRLFRSAQPTKEGFTNLAKRLGIKTIVSLREWHDDSERAAGTGLMLQRVPFNSWHIGDDNGAKIVRALRFIRQAETRGRVLVHCQHGSDRTGAIIALYRIVYQGVDKDTAIKEMMEGGFGFHPIWAVLPVWGNIPDYIRSVDVADLKRRIEAGI